MYDTDKMTDAQCRKALDFLLKAIDALEDGWDHDAIEKALAYMYTCEYQFPADL